MAKSMKKMAVSMKKKKPMALPTKIAKGIKPEIKTKMNTLAGSEHTPGVKGNSEGKPLNLSGGVARGKRSGKGSQRSLKSHPPKSGTKKNRVKK